jgi:hypothetical protein
MQLKWKQFVLEVKWIVFLLAEEDPSRRHLDVFWDPANLVGVDVASGN